MSNNYNTILVIDCVGEGEDKFGNLELMRGFYDELKNNPNSVLATIKRHIELFEDECIENDICPECGEPLEFERDTGCDTYVPYGSTSVCFEEGGHMICPKCGFVKGD